MAVLPIPVERDFPVGAMELRRAALVAAVAADCAEAGHPLRVAWRVVRRRVARVWLIVAGLAIAVGLMLASFGGFHDRTATASEIIAVTGTAQVVTLLAAPTARGGVPDNERIPRLRATARRGAALPA